jgi:hypothetical protein
MFNKGEIRLPLTKLLNGGLPTKDKVTVETEDGFVMTFFCQWNYQKYNENNFNGFY